MFFAQIDTSGANAGYFTEETVLNRVPGLLLILAAIYLVLGFFGSIMICQPPEDWVRRSSLPSSAADSVELTDPSLTSDKPEKNALMFETEDIKDVDYVHWKQALRTKEFYLLWITRLSVVLITQVVAALYKAFGQTFIFDDFFLSVVGSICSFFNCAGRLVYGMIMDKTSYKVAMSLESVLLVLLVSTFYLTSLVGVSNPVDCDACLLINETMFESVNNTLVPNVCDDCISPVTSLGTKVIYALWVWCIFFTFPGTFAMQPAVTTQTFGHK